MKDDGKFGTIFTTFFFVVYHNFGNTVVWDGKTIVDNHMFRRWNELVLASFSVVLCDLLSLAEENTDKLGQRVSWWRFEQSTSALQVSTNWRQVMLQSGVDQEGSLNGFVLFSTRHGKSVRSFRSDLIFSTWQLAVTLHTHQVSYWQ